MKRLAVLLMVALALAGCGSPRFDGTSDESMKTTLKKMTAGMTPAQKEAMVKDIGIVTMLDVVEQASQSASGKDKAPVDKAAMFKTVQGRTAAEIHEKAEAIRRELAEEEKAK